MESEIKKIAVLIDADNISYNKVDMILKELDKKGTVVLKRAYGDWSSGCLKNWKQTLNKNSVEAHQQFAYTKGKNSTDMAMVIDAMDLLYSKKYNSFAIVSSDSDFTGLARRLRNDFVTIIGVGQKHTPQSFINACNDFIYIEDLEDKSSLKATEVCPPPKDEEELADLYMNAYENYAGNNFGEYIGLSEIGNLIKAQCPEFNPKTYGVKNQSKIIETMMNEIFDMKKSQTPGGVNVISIKPKWV